MIKYEKYGFFIMVLMCLSIIVIPDFYITGDGPSHTYNAKVWFDYLFNHHRNYYHAFYQLNRHIEPNTTSHVLLGIFTLWFKPEMADKIYQVIYVLVFAYGFRYWVKSLAEDNGFLSWLFFPFLFSLAFQQGFYNYTLAIGFMFWTIGYYIRQYDYLEHIKTLFTLFLLMSLVALSHGMIALYTLGLIVFCWIYFRTKNLLKLELSPLLKDVYSLLMIAMPAVILVGGFVFRVGLDVVDYQGNLQQKLQHFYQLHFLQSTRLLEKYPAMIFGGGIILLALAVFIQIKQTRRIGFIFLIMSAYTTYAYFTAPHSIGGAGSVDIRLGFLPFLFLLGWIASAVWVDKIKNLTMLASFLLLAAFLAIRFPHVIKASEVAKDLVTVGSKIDNFSLVLNLHLDDAHHLSDQEKIFEIDSSFIHLTDYIGAQKNKHIVLVNNYEADITYFPIQWRPGLSPLLSIPNMTPGHYPPCGDFHIYEQKTGQQIQYVMLQNWQASQTAMPCVSNMLNEIERHFKKVYTSPAGHVVLYKRNSGPASTLYLPVK